MINFLEKSREHYGVMVKIRRLLHENPEIDKELPNTSKLVCSFLNDFNIPFQKYENNGIIAEIGKDRSRIVVLRADMDALEINDLKEVPYKSKVKGYMHACGHDAHTAIQLGAAAVLKEIEEIMPGTVRLIFQPAEETYGGAKDMIGYGALDNVLAVFGLHVDENLKTGSIGVKRGMVAASSNPFKIEIRGKGSHGAYPQDGVDSIFIAAKIIDNLQGIVSREIGATNSAVVTVGKIQGGTAPNAISSHVVMEGIVRTLGKELREFCKSRIADIVNSTASMYRGKAEVNFIEGYPSFFNNEVLYNWFNNLLSKDENFNIIDIIHPTMGVEDFAYYVEKVPGLYYKLGCRNEEKGIIHPAHGGYFDIDEDSMIFGCALQSKCAYEFLLKG